MPWWDTGRMRAARILVVGVGAVGNEVLKNLALLGAGTVFAVDHDVVETTNLARCILFRAGDEGKAKTGVAARRLAEINPEAVLVPLNGLLEREVGIGFLRTSQHFIAYLDSGNFSGNDASESRIKFGTEYLRRTMDLDAKRPLLITNGDTGFDWLDGRKVECVWSL
ncbi:ThiF family adenylyltransferase, partial [bacterium]|nr:ThiF family adenylyltransferase [bacterium]